MSQTKILFFYFLMGLILGGVSGALYIVGLVKFRRIEARFLGDVFERLIVLWIVIGFIVLLGTSVIK